MSRGPTSSSPRSRGGRRHGAAGRAGGAPRRVGARHGLAHGGNGLPPPARSTSSWRASATPRASCRRSPRACVPGSASSSASSTRSTRASRRQRRCATGCCSPRGTFRSTGRDDRRLRLLALRRRPFDRARDRLREDPGARRGHRARGAEAHRSVVTTSRRRGGSARWRARPRRRRSRPSRARPARHRCRPGSRGTGPGRR